MILFLVKSFVCVLLSNFLSLCSMSVRWSFTVLCISQMFILVLLFSVMKSFKSLCYIWCLLCFCQSLPCVCCMCQLCNLIIFDHLLSSRHFLRRSSCCQQFMHNLVYIIHSPSRYVICLHAVSSFLVFVNISCICRQVVVVHWVALFCLPSCLVCFGHCLNLSCLHWFFVTSSGPFAVSFTLSLTCSTI